MDDGSTERLSRWLCEAVHARALNIEAMLPLSGGAIQENLSLQLDIDGGPQHGRHRWVLRRDAAATIAESHTRLNEHALLVAAFEAGVCVAQPIVACSDRAVLGSPFSVMAFKPGIGYGPKLVKDERLGGERERLVERLGHELARIHAIDVRRTGLGFLGPPPSDPAAQQLQRLRDGLDALGAARPGLERALRIAAASRPAAFAVTLVHRDFRTGNLLVDEHGLSAILDWEFAGLGDPMSDLGWFCARCWRFSRPDLEAGGLGARATLYRAYEAASGRRVDDASVRWWELFAHLRWAIIALQQGARHDSGGEPSLSLALTGRIADTLERDALRLALATLSSPATHRSHDTADEPRHRLPGAHLLPSAVDALTPLITAVPREHALTLRLAIRAITVAERDIGARDAIDSARRTLLAKGRASDMSTLSRAIRAGHHDRHADLDAALLDLVERVAASLDA